MFHEIGFGPFLHNLHGRKKMLHFGRLEPLVRYHSKRAKILTMCQDLKAKRHLNLLYFKKGFGFPQLTILLNKMKLLSYLHHSQ